MIERGDIASIHWQMRLGRAGGDPAPGDIVTDYDDIDQEIRTIILTPTGSVPTNPLKGCNALRVIDQLSIHAAPLLCQTIWDAVATWVTRIEVGSVTAEAVEIHHWRVTIPWRVKGTVAQEMRTSTVDLSLASYGGLYAQ